MKKSKKQSIESVELSSKVSLGGVGNTPPYNSIDKNTINSKDDMLINVIDDFQKIKTNYCIDWINFTFYTENPDDLVPVLLALKVNPNDFEVGRSRNYKYRRTYDESVNLSFSGDETAEGHDTSLLELSGSACRLFELRGGNWYQLFYEIFKTGGHCTRIDTPMDNFTKLCSLEDIEFHLKNGLVCTKLRIEEKSCNIVKELFGGGYTINIGSGEIRLCWYNKKAERSSNGSDVYIDTWVRLEFRFYGQRANEVFQEVFKCLGNESYDKESFDSDHISIGHQLKLNHYLPRLFNSIIEFKQATIKGKPVDYVDNHNRKRLDPWSQWCELLETSEKQPLIRQSKIESSVIRKQKWMDLAVMTSLAVNYCSLNELDEFTSITSDKGLKHMLSGIKQAMNEFTTVEIAQINNYRRKVGKELIDQQFIDDGIKILNNIECDLLHYKSRSLAEGAYVEASNLEAVKQHEERRKQDIQVVVDDDNYKINFDYDETDNSDYEKALKYYSTARVLNRK